MIFDIKPYLISFVLLLSFSCKEAIPEKENQDLKQKEIDSNNLSTSKEATDSVPKKKITAKKSKHPYILKNKLYQNGDCDTLKSFGDKESWCYYIKSDTVFTRWIYTIGGSANAAFMLEEGYPFLHNWFNEKGRLYTSDYYVKRVINQHIPSIMIPQELVVILYSRTTKRKNPFIDLAFNTL